MEAYVSYLAKSNQMVATHTKENKYFDAKDEEKYHLMALRLTN